MAVHLRTKKLKSGKLSYYLDINHNKNRWYEFLEIHTNQTRLSEEDKERKQLALQIRSKRETELIVQDNGLVDRSKKKADYIAWFEKYIIAKKQNHTHNRATLVKLRKYMGKMPLPFTALTPVWIKGFTNFLLGEVSNNSTRCYLIDMFTSLEDAVRSEIIPANPFRKIPRHERIRQEDVFRQAYTLEQLQLLAETPCLIHSDIRLGYFFSCFTGLRWSDVNCLKWTEIITKRIDGKEEYFIYFEQEKTEGIEYFPLSDQAVDIIKHQERERKKNNDNSPYVFPFIKEYNEKDKLMQNRVRRALRKWAKAANLDPEPFTFHTSRHTFATNMLEHSPDADLWTVSKLLGHKTIQATQIYAKVRDSKKRAAVKALPKLNMPALHLQVA